KTSAPLGDSAPITVIDQRVVVVGKGETIETIARANGASDEQVRSLAKTFGTAPPVQEGEKVKLLLADLDGSGKNKQICRISVYRDDVLTFTVAIRDSGDYVQVPTETPAATPAPTPLAAAKQPPKKAPAAKGGDDDDDTGDEPEDSDGLRL